MKKVSRLFLLLLLTLNYCYLKASIPFRNVMYHANWVIYDGDKSFYPSLMKPQYITHLNFAFLDLDSNGDLSLTDEYADFQIESLPELDGLSNADPYAGVIGALFILKLKNPHLKVGISLGGWGRDANFPIVSADATKRENFANNIAKFIEYLGYDFVDIDWEYPTTSEDTENFTLFLQAIRNKLDALGQKMGKHYELTIAASASPSTMDKIQWEKVLKIIDFANMMTYDLAGGSWMSYTAHHTGLYTNDAYNPETMSEAKYSADVCIKHLQEKYGSSIDMKQILVGVAPYNRGWAGVKNDGLDPDNPGLFATASPNSFQEDIGIWEMPELMKKYELNEYFDNKAKAAYYYSPTQGIFLTIDNEKSALAKGQYVKENDLGGLIAWEASLDRESLVTKAMFDGLYDEGYIFPDDEFKYSNMKFSAQVSATQNGYQITIKNTENAVETNIALRDAEKFQKTICFMKLYIRTKSGAEFGPGDMSGTVSNKDGIGIVDPTENNNAKHIAPGGTYSFSVTVSGTPNVSDIQSITLTQRPTPNVVEFKEQIIYGS